jgi:hypothetical protein
MAVAAMATMAAQAKAAEAGDSQHAGRGAAAPLLLPNASHCATAARVAISTATIEEAVVR